MQAQADTYAAPPKDCLTAEIRALPKELTRRWDILLGNASLSHDTEYAVFTAVANSSDELPQHRSISSATSNIVELPITRVEHQIEHHIHDEMFILSIDESNCVLEHPKWSLVGVGPTLLDAEQMIIDECSDLAAVMLQFGLDELTYEALRLRDFAISVAS